MADRSTVVTRGATSRPRTGWRSNEELEAQNRALREGLEAVSASRRELEERHNLLAKHLESASESFAESYRVMRDRQARLHAQVSSGKNIARTNEELEAQLAQLSFELSQVTLEVANREQHTVLRDAKVLEEKRLAQEAIKLASTERHAYLRDLDVLTRRVDQLRRRLARSHWHSLGNALLLSRSRRFLATEATRRALQQALHLAQTPSVVRTAVEHPVYQAKWGVPKASVASASVTSDGGAQWSLELWLREVPLVQLLSTALRRRLGEAQPANERGFLTALVGDGLEAESERAAELLEVVLAEGGVLADLARAIADQAAELVRQKRRAARGPATTRAAPSASADGPSNISSGEAAPGTSRAESTSRMSSGEAVLGQAARAVPGVASCAPECLPSDPSIGKFVDAGPAAAAGFTVHLGTMRDFVGGLSARIGDAAVAQDDPFDPRQSDIYTAVLSAMSEEHRRRADSREWFVVGNYGTRTYSEAEFLFVVDPSVVGLATLDLPSWPLESHYLVQAGGAAPRQPCPLSDFEAERRRLAERLRAVAGIEGRPSHVDVLCGRLYTGPLFVKYNAVLRGASADAPPYLRRRVHELCLGNQYTTTLHALNSMLLVLSHLTAVRRVYRVVSGAALPDALRVPDELGCVGGVELGFLSTTENRELAFETAARDGGVLLELSMSPPLMTPPLMASDDL
jgi:hypothetical protein